MFNPHNPKKYIISQLLKILKKTAKKTTNKKSKQQINLCYKLLLKIVYYRYTDVLETKDLDKYLLELNNRKQKQKKDIELFSRILAKHILYAQDENSI